MFSNCCRMRSGESERLRSCVRRTRLCIVLALTTLYSIYIANYLFGVKESWPNGWISIVTLPAGRGIAQENTRSLFSIFFLTGDPLHQVRNKTDSVQHKRVKGIDNDERRRAAYDRFLISTCSIFFLFIET